MYALSIGGLNREETRWREEELEASRCSSRECFTLPFDRFYGTLLPTAPIESGRKPALSSKSPAIFCGWAGLTARPAGAAEAAHSFVVIVSHFDTRK